MSKFDYGFFSGGDENFAVNAEKYTKEQAIKIANEEIGERGEYWLLLSDSFVCHRAGINEDNQPTVGWWLEYTKRKRSCPVFAFRAMMSDPSQDTRKYYSEVMKIDNSNGE